ncbi:MAG: FtsX-like permease family protein [Candidatus Bathyarchaeia archaeon]
MVKNAIFLLLLLTLTQVYGFNLPVKAQQTSATSTPYVKYTLITYFMDYLTNSPEPRLNVTLVLNGYTVKGLTDDFGSLKSSFNASRDLANVILLNSLSVYGNFTVVKIQDYMMEYLRYDVTYSRNTITYSGLEVRPTIVTAEKEILLYYYIYTLKSRFVNVSDLDVSTMEILPNGEVQFRRDKMVLDARPAVPVNRQLSRYESLYLFPINYTVTVRVRIFRFRFLPETYPVKVFVTENTSYVNVMGPVLHFRINETISPLIERIDTLKTLGLPMVDEERLVTKIVNQNTNILQLIENRSYDSALTQLRFLAKKISNLQSNLSNLNASLMLSCVIVIAFIYAFSSLTSTLITDDARKKFLLKFILYFTLFFIFLVSHNEFKIALSILSSNFLLTDIKYLDNFTVLVIGSTLGSLGILIPTLISLYSPPIISLSLDLSIRDVKRHLTRSILTIIAFSLIIASVLAVFKISYSHILTEKTIQTSFKTDVIGLQSTQENIIVKNDLIFIKSMEWVNTTYYVKSLYDTITIGPLSGFTAIRLVSPSSGLLDQRLDIIGVDPVFLNDYFKFSLNIVRGSYISGNESAILVPSSLSNSLRLSEKVRVRFVIVSNIANNLVDVAEYDLGDFIVKGFFNPDSVEEVKLPDGSPLIEYPYRTIIVSESLLPDSIDARRLRITVPRLSLGISQSEPYYIDIFKVKHAFIVPEPKFHVDVYEKARELLDLTGCRVFAYSNGVCKTFEELYILNIVGFSSIIPPILIVTSIIVLTMNSIIYERRREIWTLAVVGGNPRSITNMFLMEALITGLLSTAIGYLFYTGFYLTSGVLAPLVSNWYPELFNIFTEMKMASGFELTSILVIVLVGLGVPLLGSYIPCVKAQGLTLLGRSPRRNIGADVRRRGDTAEYVLPVRATPLDGEALYTYLKDNFFTRAFQVRKLSGNAYQDGTFDFKFTFQFRNVLTECVLRGVRRGDTIYPILEFPAEYSDAMDLHKFIYELEKTTLNYPSWRERRIRLDIVRVQPVTRVRTVDDVLRDVKVIREQLHVVTSKLKTIEKLKATTPSELLAEYEAKYAAQADRLNKAIKRLGLELEPLYEQLNSEVQKLNTEIEKLNIAYKLGEMSEEDYKTSSEPLKTRLNELTRKLEDIRFVLTQLKMPKVTMPSIRAPAARRAARRKPAEEAPGLMYCPYCGSTNLTKTPSGSIVCGRCRRKLR